LSPSDKDNADKTEKIPPVILINAEEWTTSDQENPVPEDKND